MTYVPYGALLEHRRVRAILQCVTNIMAGK